VKQICDIVAFESFAEDDGELSEGAVIKLVRTVLFQTKEQVYNNGYKETYMMTRREQSEYIYI